MERITISDLGAAKSGDQLVVWGFLSKDQEGNLFIGEEPNIRTCCAGKKNEVSIQGLQGLDSLPQQVIALSGVLNKEGERYFITEAKFAENSSSFQYWEASFFALPIILLLVWRKYGAS